MKQILPIQFLKKVLVFSFGNFFSRQFGCIALAGLEHLILLSQPPKFWNGRYVVPCSAQIFHSYKLSQVIWPQ